MWVSYCNSVITDIVIPINCVQIANIIIVSCFTKYYLTGADIFSVCVSLKCSHIENIIIVSLPIFTYREYYNCIIVHII